MKDKYILTIMANNRSGLLSRIIGILNRKRLDIESITAARTDIHSVISITIELLVSEIAIGNLQLKIENIIEVSKTDAVKFDKTICHRVAYYKLSKEILTTPQALVLQKYNAQIVNLNDESILICKSGCDADIQNFYNQLEGKYFIGFMQSGIIADTAILGDDEYRVINIAA